MKKVAAPPPFYIPGRFTHQTFLRVFKQKTGGTDAQAQTAFDAHVASKAVNFVMQTGFCFDISIYEFS